MIKNLANVIFFYLQNEADWDVYLTQLLINTKGCGYPPRVRCDEFGTIYGEVGRYLTLKYHIIHSNFVSKIMISDLGGQNISMLLQSR